MAYSWEHKNLTIMTKPFTTHDHTGSSLIDEKKQKETIRKKSPQRWTEKKKLIQKNI